MKHIEFERSTLYANTRPLGILGTLAAAVGLAVAAVFGAVFFLLLLGVLLVVGLVVGARLWWSTRALRAQVRQSGTTLEEALRQQAERGRGAGQTNPPGHSTIEGEYHEIER